MTGADFQDKVYAYLSRKPWFKTPCHILVAVSGGADSMALLHTLIHWSEISVSAVHVHHGLRGETADRDEQFVQQYCQKHNVSLISYHEDVYAFARDNGFSLEEAGRHLRYQRFEEARTLVGADWIATAHTASDRAETTLMRILRGTGIDGLAGIPDCRGNICRPLLSCTRQEVEAYCDACHLPFVNDETNTDPAFTRNRIRHQILPMLKEINPSVEDALLRLSDHAAEDADLLLTMAHECLTDSKDSFGYRLDGFRNQAHPIQRRMIMLMMRDATVPSIEQTHIMAASQVLENGDGDVMLPGGYVFSVSQGIAAVHSASIVDVSAPVAIDSLPMSGVFGGQRFRINLIENAAENIHNLFSNTVVDYAKIEGNLHIRCRKECDSIHPAGRGVGKSLKKLMNECGIPAYLRDAYPIMCDSVGVVMIPGYAVDERVKVTDDTNHLLVWESDDVTT